MYYSGSQTFSSPGIFEALQKIAGTQHPNAKKENVKCKNKLKECYMLFFLLEIFPLLT